MIFRYKFEDGTLLKLIDNGFSAEEIWKLEELHGKLIFFYKKRGAEE